MQKLMLLSVLFAAIIIPVMAASDPLPQRGFKRALAYFLAFCFCYVLVLKFLYAKFF